MIAMHKRIIIVGATGSGKSTLARHLAGTFKIPHIEMDALYWEPHWTAVTPEVLRQKVIENLPRGSWIIDGNYSVVRDLIWPQATDLIWLNFPFYLIFWRSIKRIIKHLIYGNSLCNGNYETIRRVLFSRDSILLWALKTHFRRNRQLKALIQGPTYKHLDVIRLRSPGELLKYLNCEEKQ